MIQIIPTINCKIRTSDGLTGLVKDIAPKGEPKNLLVKFPNVEERWVKILDVENGFTEENYVVHRPPKGFGESLGLGKVLASRTQFGFTHLLVQFAETGQSRWLDWRTLGQAHPAEVRIASRGVGSYLNHAERFRLRTLSKSLQIWDMNTGALGRLDIDPLPHQLDVTRKVVSSAQARWLLADDVGLGKTIEVGLILHALEQRNRCRRVLIVCPASLTKQWKEEMRYKFSRSFEIYSKDFMPEFHDEMRSRENVIVSIDLAKREENLPMIVLASTWDVVIFDEAHRLGKGDRGEQTDRYKLARLLRDRTASMLLLTATPHQGKTKRFGALLELVRPDLAPKIRTLELNPEVVGDIIIRNKKAKVTDIDGNLIFRGHDTLRYVAQKNENMELSDKALTAYLRDGYRASQSAKDSASGRAIGFVMSTYRKLASSSVAAIEIALERRLKRLLTGEKNPQINMNFLDDIDSDTDEELSENELIVQVPLFFHNEVEQLNNLIELIKNTKRNDNKLNTFLEEIVAPLVERDENLLIFTEYKATQEYLRQRLNIRFPQLRGIELINGSMQLEDKMASIFRFNESESQILISTEAGGEGLNLQKSCHLMVNYDLPWNPSRLVQRIGRLYRYGQTKRVQVINLQTNDFFDNKALNLMLDRVTTMANDMAAVSVENKDALAADILGELLSNIDMEDILNRSELLTIERTEDEIIEAIDRAKEARFMEEDILQFSSNSSTRVLSGFDQRHVISFVEGMAEAIEIKVRNRLHRGKTLELELPEEYVSRWPEFGKKTVVRLSVDQERTRRSKDLTPMDFECSFVLELAKMAQARNFDGFYAESVTQNLAKLISLHQIRWQGLSGEILEEELVALKINDHGFDKLEQSALSELLLNPWISCSSNTQGKSDSDTIKLAKSIMPSVEKILASEATPEKTPNSVFTYAACRSVE